MRSEVKKSPPTTACELRLLLEVALRQLQCDLRALRDGAARFRGLGRSPSEPRSGAASWREPIDSGRGRREVVEVGVNRAPTPR